MALIAVSCHPAGILLFAFRVLHAINAPPGAKVEGDCPVPQHRSIQGFSVLSVGVANRPGPGTAYL